MNNQIIIRPLLTEKASGLAATGVYTFQIEETANKDQVEKVIEEMYKVKVDRVRISNKKGKVRRVGRSMKTKQMPDIKVAYIKLKEGKIDLFPQA